MAAYPSSVAVALLRLVAITVFIAARVVTASPAQTISEDADREHQLAEIDRIKQLIDGYDKLAKLGRRDDKIDAVLLQVTNMLRGVELADVLKLQAGIDDEEAANNIRRMAEGVGKDAVDAAKRAEQWENDLPTHKARLVSFYTTHNPSKLPDVDDILDKYRGQGDALFRQLEAKYLPQADEGPGETAGGVSVTVVKRATCSREAAVRKGSYIVLDWEGTQASGVSLGAGSGDTALKFTVGERAVVAGLEEGVLGMCVGEVRRLAVPADLGYGVSGTPDGSVPPGMRLDFQVTLVSRQSTAPPKSAAEVDLDDVAGYIRRNVACTDVQPHERAAGLPRRLCTVAAAGLQNTDPDELYRSFISSGPFGCTHHVSPRAWGLYMRGEAVACESRADCTEDRALAKLGQFLCYQGCHDILETCGAPDSEIQETCSPAGGYATPAVTACRGTPRTAWDVTAERGASLHASGVTETSPTHGDGSCPSDSDGRQWPTVSDHPPYRIQTRPSFASRDVTITESFLEDEDARLVRAELLATAAEASWNDMRDSRPLGTWSISFRFQAVPAAAGSPLRRLFNDIRPSPEHEMIDPPTFGRYRKGHFLERHSDWNSIVDAEGRRWDRDIAFILYLSEDWPEENGGLLIDLGGETATPIAPRFNRLVTFGVPRDHEVTPVVGEGDRLTVYGWWSVESAKAA